MTDESIMPFGKHQGKQMADVPADYLLYLYDDGKGKVFGEVREYIEENMTVLKQQSTQEQEKRARFLSQK